MKHILVAIDGSEGGERAFDAALEMAKRFSAELLIVSVEQGLLRGDEEVFVQIENATPDDILYGAVRHILQRCEKIARATGFQTVRSFAGLGDPAPFILDIAKKENVDMIVVGRRGRGHVSRLLLGSVSQKLATFADCKILIVP